MGEMSDLYEDGILLWSERQGDPLRRIVAGEPVNERPDWANIDEGGQWFRHIPVPDDCLLG